MSGSIIGILSLVIVVVTFIVWFQLIKAVRIPRMRSPFVAAMLLGILLAIVAFVRGAGLVGGIAASATILMGGIFIGIRMQSAQAKNEPAVVVAGPILNFTALDDQEEPFQLASLRGKPFLLKFFRGHW
jgi:hypothetical protein